MMDELDLQREIAESRRALVEAKRRKAELVSELNELESKAERKRQAYNKIQHEDMLYLLEDEEAVKSSSDLSQLELQFAEANAKLELKILNENIRQQLPILEKNSHKVDRMRKPKTHIVLKTEYKVSDLLQTLPSIVSASVQDLEAQFQMKIEEMSDFKWKINEKIESLKSKRLTLSKNANSMRKDIDALLEERESLRRLLIRLSSSSNLNDYKLQYVTESYLSAREKLQEVHEHGWIGIAFEIGAGSLNGFLTASSATEIFRRWLPEDILEIVNIDSFLTSYPREQPCITFENFCSILQLINQTFQDNINF